MGLFSADLNDDYEKTKKRGFYDGIYKSRFKLVDEQNGMHI